jgi:hypothetical protein
LQVGSFAQVSAGKAIQSYERRLEMAIATTETLTQMAWVVARCVADSEAVETMLGAARWGHLVRNAVARKYKRHNREAERRHQEQHVRRVAELAKPLEERGAYK